MRRLLRVLVSLVVVFGAGGRHGQLVRTGQRRLRGRLQAERDVPAGRRGPAPGLARWSSAASRSGRVSTIALKDNEARCTVLIDPTFRVPASATATIQPVNLFGAEQVSISTPDHNTDAGPVPGATAPPSPTPRSSDELGDLFAAATPAAAEDQHQRPVDRAGRAGPGQPGRGPADRRRRSAPGTQLAGLLDQTLNAQILALDSFAKFSQAMAPRPPATSTTSNAQVNAALPAFNAEEADYEKLLNTADPVLQPSWPRCLRPTTPTSPPSSPRATTSRGCCWPSRTTSARWSTAPTTTSSKIADGARRASKLPDGSTYAYFNTFILFSDVNTLVCNLLAPTLGRPVVPRSPFSRRWPAPARPSTARTQMAAFNALQSSSTRRPRDAAAGAPPTGATAPGTAAATQAYGIVGQPDTSKPTGLGGLINQLLGGA